jgi:hypothetical protein
MPDTSSLFALARTALLEITREDTIGDPLEVVANDEATSTVTFANTLPGYPGWVWTIRVATLEGEEPSVLETELLPGDSSLLAPDWVPWVERLAEYEASQEAAAHADGEGDDDSDDLDDDESDDDTDDDDTDADDDDDDDSDGDDESDDDDDFDDDDADDDDDLDEDADDIVHKEFDGIDVEEAAEAAGLDRLT